MNQEIKIPDLGNFKDVPIIEVFVKEGDIITKDMPLLTLESDKASMEVPSEVEGKILSLNVKVGDKVSTGTIIGTVEVTTKETTNVVHEKVEKITKPIPTTITFNKADHECEMLVLGAGPGGYSAAFRSADLGMKTILVERFPTLGGVCLNVGCIPSKALLHAAFIIDEARSFSSHGIVFEEPKVDLEKLREFKSKVVGKLTSGLNSMAKARNVKVVRGVGKFLDEHYLEVELTEGTGKTLTGKKEIIYFEKAIIAAGSEPVSLPFIPKDPRIVDSTGALELPFIPKKMLVIGGGIIGLEMATVYSTLGAKVDIVELLDGLMLGADRDLVKVWEKKNSHRFEKVMLKTKASKLEVSSEKILVTFEGENTPNESQSYDLVLVAVGRIPNGKKIGAENLGIQVNERGFIQVDKQMRTNKPHIFAIGDIIGNPMLAHKAVHEGHVAAEAAFGLKSYFDALQIPSVAYTDPEVAWAGLTEEECKKQNISYKKAVFPWAASGRAIANSRDEGFTKLIYDEETHRIIGGGIVGTNAGDLIGEICLAIEMGADIVDVGRTIHPHPTLCESVGLAAEVGEGICTDLMPQKKNKA